MHRLKLSLVRQLRQINLKMKLCPNNTYRGDVSEYWEGLSSSLSMDVTAQISLKECRKFTHPILDRVVKLQCIKVGFGGKPELVDTGNLQPSYSKHLNFD